jgi:thymidylate kinase
MGNVVIAERYLPDSIVSIAYTLNNPDFDSCFVSKTMLRLIPRNSILIYLDSSYEEVKKRRGVMTDPEDFLRFQREMYERLSKRTKAVKIDTAQQSVEGTAKIIRSLLRCHK